MMMRDIRSVFCQNWVSNELADFSTHIVVCAHTRRTAPEVADGIFYLIYVNMGFPVAHPTTTVSCLLIDEKRVPFTCAYLYIVN